MSNYLVSANSKKKNQISYIAIFFSFFLYISMEKKIQPHFQFIISLIFFALLVHFTLKLSIIQIYYIPIINKIPQRHISN